MKEAFAGETHRLPPGSTHRGGEAQCHFKETRDAPWPHKDCFTKAEFKYKYEGMDDGAVKRHKDKYGHQAHLVSDANSNVFRIKDVNVIRGEPKHEYRRVLTDPSPVCRKNLIKILATNFEDSLTLGHEEMNVVISMLTMMVGF